MCNKLFFFFFAELNRNQVLGLRLKVGSLHLDNCVPSAQKQTDVTDIGCLKGQGQSD